MYNYAICLPWSFRMHHSPDDGDGTLRDRGLPRRRPGRSNRRPCGPSLEHRKGARGRYGRTIHHPRSHRSTFPRCRTRVCHTLPRGMSDNPRRTPSDAPTRHGVQTWVRNSASQSYQFTTSHQIVYVCGIACTGTKLGIQEHEHTNMFRNVGSCVSQDDSPVFFSLRRGSAGSSAVLGGLMCTARCQSFHPPTRARSHTNACCVLLVLRHVGAFACHLLEHRLFRATTTPSYKVTTSRDAVTHANRWHIRCQPFVYYTAVSYHKTSETLG